MRNQIRERIGLLLLYLVLIAGAVIVITPLLYAFATSLKTSAEVFAVPVRWLPTVAHFDNYPAALKQGPFGRYFFNSLFVATGVTLLNLLTCSLAGYSFAKHRYHGRDILFGFVLATMMVPIASMVIPLFLVVKAAGWLNSYWGLIIPAGTSALGIFLMRQNILAIPDDLIAAARIDGCGELAIYWRIVLPLIGPALSSLAIFIFMWNWDSFLWPMVVATRDQYWTLPIGIAGFESSYGTNYPQMMAVANMAMAPVLVVFFILQRNFIEAMALSGIKE
ncbi:MAG: putative transporter permease protein [Firmicutes bacterium]|nr:putative transporter permease protein [Bacillota bacterium]